MRKHGVLWSAAVVAAFFAGVAVEKSVTNVSDGSGGPDLIAESEADGQGGLEIAAAPTTSSETFAVETAPLEEADHVVAEDDPVSIDEHAEEEDDEEESRSTYSYKFPFEDGRRVEGPAGDLIDNARAVYEEVSGAILERWGQKYEHTLFEQGMRFSDGGKVVEDKIINAVVEQGGFVAAFTGISVTAGHDCLYEQSYPILLNGTMSRLFAAAGVRYEAINVAMGNTLAVPYSYCVDAHAGIDADIISWEMAMMVADNACGPAAEAIELFIRQATVLPRHPAVLIMEAGPDQANCVSGKLGKIFNHNKNFVGECSKEPEAKGLLPAYRQFGLHSLFMDQLIPQFACDDKLFARDDLYHYGKTYPKPTGWHPGTHGHELVADVLFMHYARVFLSALERLEVVAPGVTAQQLRDETQDGKQSLLSSVEINDPRQISGDGTNYMGAGRGNILPNSKWCTGWRFCEGAGNYRCSNTFSPLAGGEGSRLLDMVSERTPVVNSDKSEFKVNPTEGHWAVTLNEVKQAVIDYMGEPVPERYEGLHKPRDMKWVLVGDAKSGPIDFEFETRGLAPSSSQAARHGGEGTDVDGSAQAIEDSRVVVCKSNLIERAELHDENAIKFKMDGEETAVLRPIAHRYLNSGTCVMLAADVGVGRHTLTVEPMRAGGLLASISHVIYPA